MRHQNNLSSPSASPPAKPAVVAKETNVFDIDDDIIIGSKVRCERCSRHLFIQGFYETHKVSQYGMSNPNLNVPSCLYKVSMRLMYRMSDPNLNAPSPTRSLFRW